MQEMRKKSHERFGHEEGDLEFPCGQKRMRLYPFSCADARNHRPMGTRHP